MKKINKVELGSFFKKFWPRIFFFIILIIGVFLRVWEFGIVPAGLNPDEASIGIEAYDIYKFGIDRNGMSYPVHLISWGSGQNALYAYLLIPFVAWGGLNPFSIRLPMMVAGILSLPLLYLASKRLLGEKFALTAMFFMAISPWHIINSRWAVESNILPFIFLAGFTCLIQSSQENKFFYASCVFFALCLYAYGTAYVGVPAFLFLAIPALVLAKRISKMQVIIGIIIFSLLALPIALFILINTFHLNTIHLGPITIPRLPVEARYESMAAIFGKNPLLGMGNNMGIMLNLLWTQADSFPWNYVEPFGYFYKYTFPLVVAGLLLTVPSKFNRENMIERWLLLSWMIASILIGIVHPVNLTRINLIFTPILLCIALVLVELSKYFPQVLSGAIFVLLAGCFLFTKAYHGDEYQKRAGGVFNAGIIPALEYASKKSDARICITEQTYSAYIYVLLTQTPHPSEYLDKIEWIYPSNPVDPARTPRILGRYQFRISDCINDLDAVYILGLKEVPPNPYINYKNKKFIKYQVFIPQ